MSAAVPDVGVFHDLNADPKPLITQITDSTRSRSGRATLMGVPEEILIQIIKQCIPDDFEIEFKNGPSSDYKLRWSQKWVPGILLVSKKTRNIAEPIIAAEAKVVIVETLRGQEMLSKEYIVGEEKEVELSMPVLPGYITRVLHHLVIDQSKVRCGFATDRINIASFPQLRQLDAVVGDVADVIINIAAYASTWEPNFDLNEISHKQGSNKVMVILGIVKEALGNSLGGELQSEAQAFAADRPETGRIHPLNVVGAVTARLVRKAFAKVELVAGIAKLLPVFTQVVTWLEREGIVGMSLEARFETIYLDQNPGPDDKSPEVSCFVFGYRHC